MAPLEGFADLSLVQGNAFSVYEENQTSFEGMAPKTRNLFESQQSSPNVSGKTSFLSLAFEIREKIYALSLITNSVIAPYYFPFEECDHGYFLDLRREPLAINLLAANKVIRDEAASILISKNTWYVSYAAFYDTITSSPEIPGTSQPTFRRTFWQTH